jgi:Na+/H+-translocating membrane pyrophosphatase
MSESFLTVRIILLAIPFITILLFAMFISNTTSNLIAFSALMISIFFIGISMWMLGWILDKDQGSLAMKQVADPIKEGSEGFFITQYGTIFKLAVVFAIILFMIYNMRSPVPEGSKMKEYVSDTTMALMVAISFLFGANCSAIAGYSGIWVSVRANVRVAAACKRCYNDALQICFRGGAFAAINNVALALFGISSMYLMMSCMFWWNSPEDSDPPIQEIPILLIGYGFGASFVAMFAQLGGGIYTKAADVGADLIGKVEQGIPEDDPRNPAVIADLVGDNVGDCAGQCADLFESISAEIISAMILGGYMATAAGLDPETKAGFILFPLIVHSLDLVVSTIGVFFVSTKPGLPQF